MTVEIDFPAANIGELVVYLSDQGYELTKTRGQGFHMRAGNMTLSVQVGVFNYCSSRGILDHRGYSFDEYTEIELFSSYDAEIAAWDDNNVWVNWGSDTVKGWVSPQEILEIIKRFENAAALPA